CPAFSPGGGSASRGAGHSPDRLLRAPGWPALVADAGSLPRGRRAVRTSPGGPPGAGPRRPRRAGRIAPSISASFQFLPTSGGNRGAGGVQVRSAPHPPAKVPRSGASTCSPPKARGQRMKKEATFRNFCWSIHTSQEQTTGLGSRPHLGQEADMWKSQVKTQ
ncbi:PREDICTED: myosin IC heavy chain-like, partial [Hipposideros armiger]|uniref:Myosin IC heavy chain-like n=1 Tax=Hipposideros armiger TaxID=186990 RepID=A0A8B7TCB1_HIPAR